MAVSPVLATDVEFLFRGASQSAITSLNPSVKAEGEQIYSISYTPFISTYNISILPDITDAIISSIRAHPGHLLRKFAG